MAADQPMTTAPTTGAGQGDRPVGELVHEVTELIPKLIKQEMNLAKAELGQKGKKAGVGAGLFGGSGAIALYGLGALIAAAIMGLSEAVPGWLSALIVAVVLFVIAAVLALVGKKEVSQATPPVPEHAISGVKQDVETVKESVHR